MRAATLLFTSALFATCVAASCSSSDATATSSAATSTSASSGEAPTLPKLDAGPPKQTATITASAVDTRFVTREHFLAGGEMQISGEPFAEAMGRTLANYSRDVVPTDVYFDDSPVSLGPWIDLAGFSTAVESYEYSKQPMNNVAFESGAGTSLAHAPLVDTAGAGGPAATAALAALVQHFSDASHAKGRFVFAAGTFPSNNASGDINPTGAGDPATNPLGWPGSWPTAHAFKSFDPAIAPTSGFDLSCSITSDDDPGAAAGALACADYECDATTLHLVDRATQIDPTVTPGADGFSAWKYGLWVLNYLQVMHDSQEGGVATVSAADLANVGKVGNAIVGDDGTGTATLPGSYLGSSDIEGFQAQMFIESVDNRAEDWLRHFTTTDGQTLSGFATLKDAIDYDYTSPLQWFPGEVGVTEADDGSGFPAPTYALQSANSDLLDLAGVALGYSEFYALTDTANADVGGAQPALVIFDGDPFPADNQAADGEATLHDRALGMLRLAWINVDRMHTDPASGVPVDTVTMSGATISRGTTVSTTSLAYTILSLRTTLRALSSQLELYSNNTPDSAVGTTPLDAVAINYPGDGTKTFTGRLAEMLKADGDLLYDHLTTADGHAFVGWDVSTSAPIDMTDTLDAHTAAVRGLFAAWLATDDVKYQQRAIAVFDRLEVVFYDPSARIYTATPAPVDTVEFTPLRFALLQSTLRDAYELLAVRADGAALEPDLESRVARLNKLVLNGWDDANEDRNVDWPGECVNVVGGLPRGGLQMAERTLTGETGSLAEQLDAGAARTPTSDREHDCVPEIDDAKLPSALADSITFTIHHP
jgi:hypothetical protein